MSSLADQQKALERIRSFPRAAISRTDDTRCTDVPHIHTIHRQRGVPISGATTPDLAPCTPLFGSPVHLQV